MHVITTIYHSDCPKYSGEGSYPEMTWGGFSMAGIADYECPLCKMSVFVEEDAPAENQITVGQWTRQNFPQYQSPKGRYVAILEETIELGISTGMAEEQIRSLVDAALTRCRGQEVKPDDYKGEAGDVLMNVLAYADERKFDAFGQMIKKMKTNRSRPKEFYDKKVAEKVAQGIRPDWGTDG